MFTPKSITKGTCKKAKVLRFDGPNEYPLQEKIAILTSLMQ